MRIEIDGDVIAGRVRQESVIGLNISGGPIIQKTMPLRAAQPIWRERGNASFSMSFEVCRLHDTIPEAGVFAFEHMQGLSKTGTIIISEEYDGKKIERRGKGCLKQLAGCRLIGCTTYLRYELEIGTVKDKIK